jgi:chloramphenicol 3-O-phosphotransferase
MVRRLIFIAGPPGAGKSTISDILVTLSGNTWACIHGDTFFPFMPRNDDHPNFHYYRLMRQAIIAAAVRYADAGYDVIIDYPIHSKFLAAIPKFFKGKDNITVQYVIILPPLAVCRTRAATREVGYHIDEEAYQQFEGMHARFDEDEVVEGCCYDRNVVKATNVATDALETARQIFDGLESGRYVVTFSIG